MSKRCLNSNKDSKSKKQKNSMDSHDKVTPSELDLQFDLKKSVKLFNESENSLVKIKVSKNSGKSKQSRTKLVASQSKSNREVPKPLISEASKKIQEKKNLQTTTEESIKIKKVNPKLNIEIEDPSSLTKSDVYKYPFEYDKTIYYCKYLPDHFQEQWDGIYEMRKQKNAPVDVMGASKLADYNENEVTKRFQTLISILLSSQTRDEKVSEAMINLKKHGLTIESMIEIETDKLIELIRSVGFNTSKAKYIKELAKILRDQYNGDVPKTKAEIQALPGCGPKVTNLAMWCCWNKITGLAVDTHMERIFYKRLKWSSFPKSEKQMKEIESWMPKVIWPHINEMIVGFGQTICTAKNPKCDQCLIRGTCDFYKNMF